MANINDAIKQLVMQTLQNTELSDVVSGEVINDNPLQIKIDSKIILTDEFLVLTNNVRDYETTVDYIEVTESEEETDTEETDKEETPEPTSKTAKCTIHNALKVGDNVLMLQQSGGQMFIVLDKIGGEL